MHSRDGSYFPPLPADAEHGPTMRALLREDDEIHLRGTDGRRVGARTWFRDHFHVDRYRCAACGYEVTFSRANLRSLGIDPDSMYHSHARLITNDTSAILNTFTESNADRRLVLVSGTDLKGNSTPSKGR